MKKSLFLILCMAAAFSAVSFRNVNSQTDSPINLVMQGGNWEVNSGDTSLDANPGVKEAFEKATENLDGYNYEPIALLGSQVVSGTNFCLLVRGTPVVPQGKPSFFLMYIYLDLKGNAQITRINPFDFTGYIQ